MKLRRKCVNCLVCTFHNVFWKNYDRRKKFPRPLVATNILYALAADGFAKKMSMPFLIFICIFVFVLSVFGEDTLIICVKCICICIISTCGLFARKCEETAIICRLARRCSRRVRHIRHNRLQSIVNFLQPVDGRKGPSHIVLKCTQGLVIVINCARQQCFQLKETKKIYDMSHLLLLGKFEYGGGPIFKVVLEC